MSPVSRSSPPRRGGVLASIVLSGPSNLTPILDLGLRLEVHSQDGELVGEEIPGLSASLLACREAVMVASVALPRKKGPLATELATGARAHRQPRASGHLFAAVSGGSSGFQKLAF